MPRATTISLRLSAIGLGLTTVVAAAIGAPPLASAAPAPVSYSAKLVGKSVTFDVTNGTVAVENDRLAVKNNSGTTVMVYPLSYSMEDRTFPIKAKAAGRHATLTPVTDVAKSTALSASQLQGLRHSVASCKNGFRGPQTRQQRDDEAFNRFISQMQASVSIGSLVGLAIGAAVGFIGLALGPVALVTVPTFAALGAIIGTIASGAPVVEYWNQYNRTIHSKFKPQCA